METVTKKIDFIAQHFGECNVSRDGTNVAVKCPSCGKGNKKKLSICLETWRCHCWVCGIKGKNIYGLLKNFRSQQSAKEYASIFNIKGHEEEVADTSKVVNLPPMFMLLADNLKSKDPDFKDVLKYLRRRGVTDRQLWKHKIGTCITGGYWNRRVIFPSFDKEQNLNYYVSRAIDDETKPKYVNAKVKKSEVIFDEMRIDWKKELTIVEGVFDMIKSNDNTTCILGSSISMQHAIFEKIVQNKTPVLLALDDDVIDKSHKIASLLCAYDINVRIVDTSGYEDVGAMSRNEFLKRANEADSYTGDAKLNFMIQQISSGSIF